MSENTYTTPKGTKLPLMNLKGKPYLMVAHRLVWFREQMPNAVIETTPYKIEEESAIFIATIRSENGTALATATKRETKKDFPDFIEKAETGAIGRALALAGFGTQFTTQDFDEEGRLADAPVAPPTFREALQAVTAPATEAKSTGFKPVVKAGPAKKTPATSAPVAPTPPSATTTVNPTTTASDGWS